MTHGINDTPVRGHDGTDPVQRIRRAGVGDSVQRDLAAHQIHEQGHHRPQAALTEGNLDVSFPTGGAYLLLGVLHFRHESTEGLADMKDIDYTQR